MLASVDTMRDDWNPDMQATATVAEKFWAPIGAPLAQIFGCNSRLRLSDRADGS